MYPMEIIDEDPLFLDGIDPRRREKEADQGLAMWVSMILYA
jgi:hypothetical protein